MRGLERNWRSFFMTSNQEIVAWREANQMAIALHRYCDKNWKPGRAAAMDQARRSALSIQLNIAEGRAFGPGPRCRFHLRVAYASAVETTEAIDFMCAVENQPPAELLDLSRRSRLVQALTLKLLKAS